MDLIMASSRGSNLDRILSQEGIDSPVHTYPGGKYIRLANEAVNIIHMSNLQRSDIHVYFICGFPDVTTKMSGRNYQEVVFTEPTEQAADRVISCIKTASDIISDTGALPIFSTILPGHLESWNLTRLNQGKTSALQYSSQYDVMQKNLHSCIIQINKSIVAQNISKAMTTPLVHEIIQCIRKPGQYSFMYNRLASDGVHLSSAKIKYFMVYQIAKSIKKNRGLPVARKRKFIGETELKVVEPESEVEEVSNSPKRAWRPH